MVVDSSKNVYNTARVVNKKNCSLTDSSNNQIIFCRIRNRHSQSSRQANIYTNMWYEIHLRFVRNFDVKNYEPPKNNQLQTKRLFIHKANTLCLWHSICCWLWLAHWDKLLALFDKQCLFSRRFFACLMKYWISNCRVVSVCTRHKIWTIFGFSLFLFSIRLS